jgi:hypothetical protein
MRPTPELLDALAGQLPADHGLLVGLGDLDTIAALARRLPELVAILPPPAGRRPRVEGTRRALWSDPLALPLPPCTVDVLIGVSALSRLPDPVATIEAWAQHLRKGAYLVVAEPLVRSATLRRIRGLIGGERFTRTPEELTGLLLNAGFGDIGQSVTQAGGACFITSARWRGL